MTPKVKSIKTFKIKSVLQYHSEEFTKCRSKELNCNLCSYKVSYSLCFLVESQIVERFLVKRGTL